MATISASENLSAVGGWDLEINIVISQRDIISLLNDSVANDIFKKLSMGGLTQLDVLENLVVILRKIEDKNGKS